LNADALAEAIWSRLLWELPRALLIGQQPEYYHNYIYVNQKPYEAIVLGILPAGELLHMPNDAVCEALLEGKPVYLWHRQRHHMGTGAVLLRQELRAAEERLRRLGVQVIGGQDHLLTADTVKAMLQRGERPWAGARMTPLAKDLWEGNA